MELSLLLLIVGFSLFEAGVIPEGPTNNPTEALTSHKGGAVSFGGKCQSDRECQLTDPSTMCHIHIFIGVCVCKTGYKYTDNDACELVGRENSFTTTARISDSSEDGMLSTKEPWWAALTLQPSTPAVVTFVALFAVLPFVAIVVGIVKIYRSLEKRRRKGLLENIEVVPNPDSKY